MKKFKVFIRSAYRSTFFHLFPLFIFLSVLSCKRSYNTQHPAADTADIERLRKEVLLRVNQELVEEEMTEIDAFVARNGWNMETTESGLRYMIYGSGRGEKVSTGRVVTLEYSLSLLDGTNCYSSAQFGQKSFRVGQGGVEAGLEEGILLMQAGDKARFIMPPHLAHGLVGDGDCIPRRAIILYDVELVSLR